MATFEFSTIAEKYDNFVHPSFLLKINGEDINDICQKIPVVVFDVSIDLTSGYEASTCEFSVGNVYDKYTGNFEYKTFKDIIGMGSKVEVFTGYDGCVTRMFVGLITAVSYMFEDEDLPCIRITAMDAKGIMMSSSYSKQIKAKSYSDAVKSVFTELKNKLSTANLSLFDDDLNDIKETPDAKEKSNEDDPSDRTIEMVAESDYEFVVRAAKRYYYEFFFNNGHLFFRPPKADTNERFSIGSDWPVHSFDIGYDITGMVETIEARGMDVAKGEMISKSVKYTVKNLGSKGSALFGGMKKVYIDSSIRSVEDAELRAQSLYEMMSYRYGHLEMSLPGIPEFLPGYFYEIKGFGQGPDNKYYITRVVHSFDRDGRYNARISGIANSNGGSSSGGAGGLI